jgi:hypothetical protein
VVALAWAPIPAILKAIPFGEVEGVGGGPPPGECQTATSYISGIFYPQAQVVDLYVENPTAAAVTDTVVYYVIVDGVPRTLTIPYRLPRMTKMRIRIEITVPFQTQGFQSCGGDPWGLTDGPDPVIHITAGDYVAI